MKNYIQFIKENVRTCPECGVELKEWENEYCYPCECELFSQSKRKELEDRKKNRVSEFQPSEKDPYGEEDWQDENLKDYQIIGRNYRQKYAEFNFGDFDEIFFEKYPDSETFVNDLIKKFREWNEYITLTKKSRLKVDKLTDKVLIEFITYSDNTSTILDDMLGFRLIGIFDEKFVSIIKRMIYEILTTEWNNSDENTYNHLFFPLFMSFEEYLGLVE